MPEAVVDFLEMIGVQQDYGGTRSSPVDPNSWANREGFRALSPERSIENPLGVCTQAWPRRTDQILKNQPRVPVIRHGRMVGLDRCAHNHEHD